MSVGAMDYSPYTGARQAAQEHAQHEARIQQIIGMQQVQSHANLYGQALNQQTLYQPITQQELKTVAINEQTLPDISLTRVLKWGVVLLIALALGKKVWATFGDKLTSQLHKALDTAA